MIRGRKSTFRISVERELPLEVSPDEFHHLEKIARSYRKDKKERKIKKD
ncbi:MAG: hypothetical protein JW731_14350 [Bacteroidales bacterium]|nr:hypothetical protein [Bacteroidales bacterium]